jgi:hypothetical protein
MNEESKSVPELPETGWNLNLAFLVDITSLLNALCTKLQGKGKLLPYVISDIKAFEMKLKLINTHAEERNLAHFPTCKSAFETSGEKKICMATRNIFRNYPTASKRILIKIQ